MANGPSFAGPLTGWTSSTLVPQAAVVVQTTPPAARDPLLLTPAEKTANNQRYTQLKQEALAAEKIARESNDPAKLMEAYQLTALAEQHRPLANTTAEHTQNFRTAIDAFTARNPGFVPPPMRTMETVASERAARQATQPTALPFSAVTGGRGRAGTDLSQYDLTSSELGGGLGPDPRRVAAPTTGLESLLAAIFPDAAAAGAVSPGLGADPRNPGAPPSLLNTILGNLGQQPVAATPAVAAGPSFAGPAGSGAAIAATIPGAPPFLGGAIDRVLGTTSGFVAPTVPAVTNPLNSLSGIAAISAEQRIQQQQMEAARQAQQLAFFEQTRRQQAAADDAARLQRLRTGVGGAVVGPSNLSPTQAWLQSFQPPTTPVFTPYIPRF